MKWEDRKKQNIPVGVSDFENIRNNHYYYVDKTGMIGELLKTESTAVTLITRPRRFGKTLGMSMLRSFFDIRRDSRQLFDGLEITQNPELCQCWMNQHPTIFLSFKDVDGLTFASAYGMLCAAIAQLYKEHLYLLDSDRVNYYDREKIRRIVEGNATPTDMKHSIALLMAAMEAYYSKPVILLLDEYDVPIAKASSNGYYAEMLEVIKAMMSTALKDNPSLRFAVLTGCLKIAKESIFTGTNNFTSDTITASGLNEYFGFTEKEVRQLLQESRQEDAFCCVKEWYDGYCFGDFDVYCPWDVMNYLRDLQRNPKARPVGYWKNTSDNAIIRSFIDYAGSSITGKIEKLMSGGYILQQIEEDLTYDYLHASEDNLWSVLYLTGYLTKVRKQELPENLPEGVYALKIPNFEIREIFETTIRVWFSDSVKKWDRKALFEAVWKGQNEAVTREVNTLLRMTISYYDYKEDFYHAFLAGIFAGAVYMVESNKEYGEGRSDVVVYDSQGSRAAVFEVKCSKSVENMGQDCALALAQIKEQGYGRGLEDRCDHVFCYGIAFYKKRCLAKLADS